MIDRLADAVPVAEALLRGGISALEITLRTPAGYDAITAMKSAFPDAVIGAGTVCSDQAYDRAVGCGADFIVSPGATDQLFAAAARAQGAISCRSGDGVGGAERDSAWTTPP